MTTIDYTEALRERLHSRNVAQVIKRRVEEEKENAKG